MAGKLVRAGVEVLVEAGAGAAAHFEDPEYVAQGVRLTDEKTCLDEADVLLKVQPPSATEVKKLREGTVLIGLLNPLRNLELVGLLAERRITSLALELLPRITRAQAMDALSSQASITGYKAVLLGADRLSKFLPMLTTPTGTIRPAKVLIIGAGVAGLQAIATAKRLGAMVEAYDVRPETREQCESLGAKFVQVDVSAAGSGGYARELTAEERARQQEILGKHVARADLVVTTAAVPGRASPRIITKEMVEAMRAGSVIIDLAAEGGGNCEVTEPGETNVYADVLVYGPLNVPSMVPYHASETYSKNLHNLLLLMVKDGQLAPDWEDEVLAGALLTRDSEVIAPAVKKLIEEAAP
ncbi:MAG TPA: NAD(P)(+) transhydrogenase (Re/Si-specific) subunit alpha [Gammaproteobacteria bacterium]|nr:NAD(P)(+) transhydrogenase (Re/Si-specific) subunit alpha [Gammaproteobacteria bacterium]